jgi:hypothetical protein
VTPLHVLLARLAHKLEDIRLSIAQGNYDRAQDQLKDARQALDDIQRVA